MPKLVYPLHVGCDFAGLGRFCRNGSKLLVEVEVGSCGSGDEPRPTTEGEILDCPLDKNQNAALELDYVHQKEECLHERSRQARDMKDTGISSCGQPASRS